MNETGISRAMWRSGKAHHGVWNAVFVVLMLLMAGGDNAWAQAEAPRFDVFEYRVEGNTVLATEAVERAVYPYLGEQRTIDDVESARAALEKAYRDAGFGTVLVDLPQQRVADGVVSIRVLEAAVARLRVTGSRYFSQDWILAKVPGLAEGAVPNFPAVQAQLATVNRSADRRVTPLLRPGKTPGTTEAELIVEDRLPLSGSIELNNRQSPSTSATRLVAALRYDNLWQRDHSIGLQAQISPENRDEVEVISATYLVPRSDGAVVLSLTRSNSSVFAGVGDTNLLGRGTIAGLRVIQVLGGGADQSDTLTWGADYKDFDETVNIGIGSEDQSGFSSPVRYLPFTANYAFARGPEGERWSGSVGVSMALRGLASNDRQFADKRFGATSGFLVFKAEWGRDWKPTPGSLLSARLGGQLASTPLISNEQFVAGGVDSVRGYREGVASADQAVYGRVEWRWPGLFGGGASMLKAVDGQLFVEGAALEIKQPLPQQETRFRLIGTGFGLRLQAASTATLSLNLGVPLLDAGGSRRGDVRLHASGLFEF